jgi:hypothetical protein
MSTIDMKISCIRLYNIDENKRLIFVNHILIGTKLEPDRSKPIRFFLFCRMLMLTDKCMCVNYLACVVIASKLIQVAQNTCSFSVYTVFRPIYTQLLIVHFTEHVKRTIKR